MEEEGALQILRREGKDQIAKGILRFDVQCALLQRHVPRSYFLEHVDKLTAGQYRDVVAERAVAGLCGFPLCSNYLPDSPSRAVQRYRISVKEKRVYDVSERTLFCSDECLISAKLEEVHLRAEDGDPLPPKRSASSGSATSSGQPGAEEITERADVGLPSTDFSGSGELEGYVWGQLLTKDRNLFNHPSRTRPLQPYTRAPMAIARKASPAAKEGDPKVVHGASIRIGGTPTPSGSRVSRTGMSEEDWVKEGPTILQGILDKRRKVQVISLEEAVQLETTQMPAAAIPARLKPTKPTDQEDDEDGMSDDDEDEDNFLPEPMLSLFAQLWSTLSDWPSSRSRAFLQQSSSAQDETSLLPMAEAEEESPPDYGVLPISDADQERARWRTIHAMLLRELPSVCAQLHVSVPLHSRLSRLLETFSFPRPLMLKPQQLRLVLVVLLEVLGCGDAVLRHQLQASDSQRKSILAACGLSEEEWKLLVELFV